MYQAVHSGHGWLQHKAEGLHTSGMLWTAIASAITAPKSVKAEKAT